MPPASVIVCANWCKWTAWGRHRALPRTTESVACCDDDAHAGVQHGRTRGGGGALSDPAAVSAEPRQPARPRARQEVLRPARAAADGQDIRVAGVARPAQRARRLPLRVRQRRERTVGARERRRRHARRSCGAGVSGERDVGRRNAGGHLAGRAGTRRSARCAPPSAVALVPGRSEAAGAADRRDRRAHRGHATVGAAPVAHGIRRSPRALPALRSPVRRGGRARLPYPFERRERAGARRQRLQHQVEVVFGSATSPRRRCGP